MIGIISYNDALLFAQSWGALYFIAMFAVALAYALWPSNTKRFREAAESPLRGDEDSP